MDNLSHTAMFAALSHQTRLDVFQQLIKSGPSGMLSGEIGDLLGVRQNTMSANLAVLLRSGLVRNERQGRATRYFANFETISGLLSFLLEDCCGGDASLCSPVLKNLPGMYGSGR